MSALPWFKVQTKILDDEIIDLLDFEHRWHFVALLACKGSGLLDRAYPTPEVRERALAKKLGLDVERFREVLELLLAVGLVDARGQPAKWDKHQGAGETGAERTRRWREKKGVSARQSTSEPVEQGAGRACDVTCDAGDVTVTPLELELEAETETDTDAALRPCARAREPLPRPATLAAPPADPGDWVAYFVTRHGFAPCAARSANTADMFARWIADGVSVEQVEEAYAIAAARPGGPPRSPFYLDGIVADLAANVAAARPAANDGTTARPAAGRGRRAPPPRAHLTDHDFAKLMTDLHERELRAEHDARERTGVAARTSTEGGGRVFEHEPALAALLDGVRRR